MVSSNATLLASNPTFFTISSPFTTRATLLNVSKIKSFPAFPLARLNSISEFHKRHFSSVQAQKKPRNTHTEIVDDGDYNDDDEDEFDDFNDEEDEFDDDEDEFDDDVDEQEEEEEREEMFIPFGRMKEWLENKPRGFGEGKVYATSIEDKLLEEIEQSRKAQAINVNNLKNNPVVSSGPKKQPKVKKVIEDVVPGAVRVRLVNLPKKKNVHRDLNTAFKGVSGIVNVVPAVTGSKKTKDPICKGFAFVDFKNMENAVSFVEQFSRQSIPFGRVEKKIKCEILNSQSSKSAELNSQSSKSAEDGSAGIFHSAPESMDSASGGLSDYELEEENFSEEELEDDMFSDQDNEFIEADFEDITENVKSFSISDTNGADRPASATRSSSSKKPKKNSTKKRTAKGSGAKVQKLDVPGSAKRLKIKEKSILTDVFSKYGSQRASISSEGS